jgi:transketolase
VFDRQEESYQSSVLPAVLPAVAIEAGATRGWYKYVGRNGAVIGIDRFGESASEKVVYAFLGITTDHVVAEAKRVLGR